MVRTVAVLAVVAVALSCSTESPAQDNNQAPLRIFIRGGAKTHGPGEHDHPQPLKDWPELPRARGAMGEAALPFPTSHQLGKTAPLVLFAAASGTIRPADR